MLTPLERRNLLRIEQSRKSAVTIASAIKTVLVDNPAVDLLEIDLMPFREAASSRRSWSPTMTGFYVPDRHRNSGAPNSIGSAGRRNRTGRCWRGIELRIDRVAARSTPVVCGSHRTNVGQHHYYQNRYIQTAGFPNSVSIFIVCASPARNPHWFEEPRRAPDPARVSRRSTTRPICRASERGSQYDPVERRRKGFASKRRGNGPADCRASHSSNAGSAGRGDSARRAAKVGGALTI